MIHPFIEKAYQILDNKPITKDLALKLLKIKNEDILDLVSLANKVKNKFSKDEHICSIINAKSGMCSQDCSYCAQSSYHNVPAIETYPLKSKNDIIKEAETAQKNGVKFYGLVTSGLGYLEKNDEFDEIIEIFKNLKKKYSDMNFCASLGILSEENVIALKEVGIAHYNINLQVNPEKYSKLISKTHKVEDRIKTIKFLKKHGIKVCSGAILGLGETLKDRIELAYILKELDVDSIPLNVLIPIEGTPLEKKPLIKASEVTFTFSLFRIINPTKTIKFAAGRESRMKDFQGLLMLAGANGFLTGGYLTTRGRDTKDDLLMKEELDSFKSEE